jgi:hypothetical protein
MKKCKFCLASNENNAEKCIVCTNDRFWEKTDGFDGDVW